jgi:hypothetical protein
VQYSKTDRADIYCDAGFVLLQVFTYAHRQDPTNRLIDFIPSTVDSCK